MARNDFSSGMMDLVREESKTSKTSSEKESPAKEVKKDTPKAESKPQEKMAAPEQKIVPENPIEKPDEPKKRGKKSNEEKGLPKRVPTTYKIEEDIAKAIRRMAAEEDHKVGSDIVNEALRAYILKHSPESLR